LARNVAWSCRYESRPIFRDPPTQSRAGAGQLKSNRCPPPRPPRAHPAHPARGTDPVATTLPGQARVELRAPDLDEYLNKEFLVPQLDQLAPKLWLVRRKSQPKTPGHGNQQPNLFSPGLDSSKLTHIGPPPPGCPGPRDRPYRESAPSSGLELRQDLHQAYSKVPVVVRVLAVSGRTPCRHRDVQKATIGFMRSYSHLIQYECDFDIAQDKGLIPKSDGIDTITWDAFAQLIMTFDQYEDANVSPRYSYGELRLTRLNFYTRIFLGKLTFHHIDAQWGAYLNRFIAPILTIFAITSIILNAMQVELSVQSVQGLGDAWVAFTRASRWFSVATLFSVGLFSLFMIVLIMGMFCHDIWFARDIIRKKSYPSNEAWKTSRSGVV
jgi:hypothetical protein